MSSGTPRIGVMTLLRLLVSLLLSLVVGIFANPVSMASSFQGVQFGASSSSESRLVHDYDAGRNFPAGTSSGVSTAVGATATPETVALAGWANTPSVVRTDAAESGDGLICLRTDTTGGLKPYVGQTSSMDRFIARQAQHTAANADADFEFGVLQDGIPKSELDSAEQFWINGYGGPPTATNPFGGLSNARNQMIFSRYIAAGGGG